ncbi:HAD family phosphatase [Archangium sp.]|uniref:HAD family hydrolase n=1 Tax=Archangium sp. TaxID=1872627 RepID=UPI002D61E869|nr:HAD family phosphatase [Archangium sp.]HYO56177.1 HAD family phosphatase [Archangium sp.]
MFNTILFDLDGTIVDTDPLHFLAWKAVFAEHGRVIDERFYKENISGRFNPEILQVHFPAMGPEEIRRGVEKKEACFFELATALAPLPGLLDVIAWAKALGVQQAVVTNAPAGNARFLLSALGISGSFCDVVLAEEAKAAKPDPALYRFALARLQIDPKSAIAFEDSPAGIHAAVTAGIPTIGITSTHGPDQLCAVGAMMAVPDFTSDRLWKFLNARA